MFTSIGNIVGPILGGALLIKILIIPIILRYCYDCWYNNNYLLEKKFKLHSLHISHDTNLYEQGCFVKFVKI